MNLTNADDIQINGKTVQSISLDGKEIYRSGPKIVLTSDKSYILTGETVTLTLNCEELPDTKFNLYKVINMTKTLLDTLTTDENGQATYTYEGEGAGEIGFVAEYDGDSSNTVTVDDYTPAVTSISLIVDTSIISYGGSVTLTAIVKDQHSQSISGETVTFKNGSTTLGTGTTNSNGVATLTKSDLNAGTYYITAEISSVSSSVIPVIVQKLNTSLTINVPALVYSDVFDVTGVLKDVNNTPLSGETVTLSWSDGVTQNEATATTNNDGEVTFHRDAPTSLTEYVFSLWYEPTTNYNSSGSSVVEREVGKETSVLNVTSPTTGAAITGSTFSVAGTLSDNDGTAMASRSVVVKLGNTTLATLTTDSNGDFSDSVSSSGLSDGSNILDFVFAEETYYTGATQQVTVTKSSFDGISLSSDKSILSKADNESATLTAQLMNGQSSASVSGQTVTFEVRKSSDDSLVETLSGNTNASGVATVSYLGKGTGDLYTQAIIGGIISSKIYVEDCTYYWDCLSDDGHWTWHSSMGRSYSSNGVTIARSSGEGAICSKCDIELPSEFECSFQWNGGQNYSICVNAGGGGIENQVGVKTWYYLRQCAVSSSNVITENTGASNGDVFKIVRENGQIKYYRNDVLKGTNNLSQTDYNYLELTAYSSNRTSTIKDIKIKPL